MKTLSRIVVLLVAPLLSSLVHTAPLMRGLGPEPDSLDIHHGQGVSSLNILRDIREGLLTVNAQGQAVAGAAAGWEVSRDGTRYRFEIDPSARWSDGQPVTADDFARGWRRALDPATASANAQLLSAVKNARAVLAGTVEPEMLGIEAVDDETLKIELEQPVPWLLYLLTHPVSYPLSQNGSDDHRQGPFNGAYMLQSWVPNAELVLQANPHRSAAFTPTVKWFPVQDPASELARYRAGELHITETIPPGRYRWLVANLGRELQVHPYLGTFFLGLNLRREPFVAQPGLRRALALAIDRGKLTDLVLASGEQPAFSLVPPGLGEYQPQAMALSATLQAEREEEARSLYRAAGYSAEKPLRLQLRFNTSSTHRRMAIAVAAMWKQVLGVHTELVNEEWKVYVNNRRHGVVTQVFRGGWIADYADPSNFLDLFDSRSEQNWSGYASAELDRYLDTARRMPANRQRRRVLQQAEQLLMNDLPLIPLYYYVSRHLVKPEVEGFVPNVMDVHLSRYLTVGERNTQ